METKDYYVLLYYCFTPIEDPEAFREEHHLFCLNNNLKGRIIIASEGLNGTISGLKKDCEIYMKHVKSDPRFANIDFKIEEHSQHTFEKLHVRTKKEIVHADLPHIKPWERTGIHVEPAEFKKMMKEDPDVVLVDFRSNYEHEVGRFKGAVTLNIENLRDFPEKMNELEPYRHKKVITYCTGGIKCEKASAYLLEQGFENVYQLHGGIIKYGIEEGGEDFEGKCYVFDNRLAVDVNKVNPVVISKCFVCGTECDRMVNCANPDCNEHVPICEKCGIEMEGACSETCRTNPRKRPYNGTGYYQKVPNGYNPKIGLFRRKVQEES
ncbi:MAG: rhodanese-related sulfurtransferase [Bacteroidota bacterium]|nr:rhodanese-related sulfurtransferase [Bacteroidota bacterium]